MKYKLLLLLTWIFIVQSPEAYGDWDWELTPYLWAAGIDADITAGDTSVSMSMDFEEIVNVLQGGILLRLEGTSDSNGVFADLVFLALEEEEAKDTLGGTLEVDVDSLIVEAGYRRTIRDGLAFDIGVRYWEFDTKLTPALLSPVRSSSDWLDGFVGVRFANALGENWRWVLRGNVGAGGSDLALGIDLDLRRELANGNSLTFGFRALDIDYSDTSGAEPLEVEAGFMGLTIGYTFDL